MSNEDREPTVEECLRELREMFPATRWIEVICSQYARDSLGPVEYVVKFEAPLNQGRRFVGAALTEAMAHVRAWRRAQEKADE